MRKLNDVLNVLLPDSAQDHGKHRVELEIESHGIAIRPVGYGDKTSLDGCGSPAFIEFRNAVPYLIVWDDINREEPSHVISLEKAAEGKRE